MRNVNFRPAACHLGCFILSCILLVSHASTVCAVELPRIFAKSMVLQRDSTIPIWGKASADETITVSLGEREATATAGEDGKWRVDLEPLAAGGPLTLKVAGESGEPITVEDVYIGEVWLCGGQSNMEWTVRASMNPEEEIFNADFPLIRHFKVGRKIADAPQDDCSGSWAVCSPQTAAEFTAVGYYFARHLQRELNVPIGLIGCNWGGTLAEAWTSKETLQTDEDFAPILDRAKEFQPNNPNQASVLYQGMLHPLVPFGIRGAIWYQGESNVSRAEQYNELFPAMIADWRNHWQREDLPFYFVQLAPFRYRNADPAACAELWEAQLKTLSVPHTGMAVTTDIGNVKDIHPKNKQEVGRRLSLWALAKLYGQDELIYSGPLFESARVDGHQIRVTFEHAAGLKTRDGQPVSHLMVAGEDQKFHPATGTIEGDTLIVSSEEVSQPIAVRYAWQDDAEPNLCNGAGLPASPFRSDDFPGVTAGNR